MARWLSRPSEHEQVAALLSPYLDGQVSEVERALVERHLKSCSDCAHNLATLRATVAAVREMPRVRAPRSFALPRSMARQPRTATWIIPALRATTAVATLLFVIAVAGDLFTRSTTVPTFAPMAAPASVAQESTAASVPSSAPEKAAPLALNATQALAPTVSPTPVTEPPIEQPLHDGGLGAGGAAGGTGQSTQPPSAAAQALATPSARQADTSATGITPTAKLAGSAATPTAGPQATTPPEASPAPVVPTQVARAAAPAPLTAVQPKAEPQAVFSAVKPLRIAEGVLAVLAIALGITTWIVHRRNR